VCVGQCVAVVVAVHRTPSLLPDACRFLDLSGTSVRLPVTEPHTRQISCHVASLPWPEPEEELNKLLPAKVSDGDRPKRQGVLKRLDVYDVIIGSRTKAIMS